MAKQTSLQRLFRKSGLFGARRSTPQLEATRQGSRSLKDRASRGGSRAASWDGIRVWQAYQGRAEQGSCCHASSPCPVQQPLACPAPPRAHAGDVLEEQH